MNVLLLFWVVLVGLLLVLEVGLRWLFGFGNSLLYLKDEEIGYLLAPNQRTRRFGNRIAINEYSMRSPTITRTRPTSTLRVLLLGDSVANGAWWTDQDQTISALIATQLELVVREASGETLILQSPFERVEVLNASANSWGPRNELAYLQRFGSFEAQAIVLLLNTDDLFAAAPTSEPVGRDRNYPNRKPFCALAEVFNRYLSPKLPRLGLKAVTQKVGEWADRGIGGISPTLTHSSSPILTKAPAPLSSSCEVNTHSGVSDRLYSFKDCYDANGAPPLQPVALAQQEMAAFKDDPLDFNLEAIRQIQAIAAGAGASFVLAMTPLLREIGEPGPRDYELIARDRLTQLTQDEQISYLDFLPMFNSGETPQRLYRDRIHLSPQGNQRVGEAIARSLQQLLHLPVTSFMGK